MFVIYTLRQCPAVVIEWEANALTVVESASNIFLCASIVNPDLTNFQQTVQLQVFTQNSTAQGTSYSVRNANVTDTVVHIL